MLSELPDRQVAEFAKEFRRQLARLNRWSRWDAGYAANGGMGDDSFRCFRSWLIGEGAEVVDLALANPEMLVPYLDTDELDNELLEYVAEELLDERGVDIDEDATFEPADGEPAGEPFDEDTSEDRYPKLSRWGSRIRSSGEAHGASQL